MTVISLILIRKLKSGRFKEGGEGLLRFEEVKNYCANIFSDFGF